MNTEERFKHHYEFSHLQWVRLTDVHKEEDLLLLLDQDKLILAKYLKPFGFRKIAPPSMKLQTKRSGWKRSGWKGVRRRQRRERKCKNVA